MLFYIVMFTDLIAKTLNRKHLDTNIVPATGIKSYVAKTLFPNIANIPAIQTEQLLSEYVTRKTMTNSQI